MTGKRFFSILWRINAVAILLTALLACGVLFYASYEIFKDATRTRQVSDVVNIADEQLDRSTSRLGAFERVEGSTALRAPLWLEQEYGFSSGSKGTSSVQNYLYYDPISATDHWLEPGYKGLILTTQELPERKYNKSEEPVVTVVYELIDADSNGDKRLSERDVKVVAMSNPSGTQFRRLLTGVELLNGTNLTPEGHVLIFYTASSTLRVAEVDVEAQRVIRESVMQVAAPRVKG